MEPHAGVTKEQIARAKEWDLLSYLRTYEPDELVKSGPHEYCTRTHDSLKISNGKWHWYSRGIGGRTALDYLIHVERTPFVRAVETLCGDRAVLARQTELEGADRSQKPFTLPEAAFCPSSVVPYLQRRGIDTEIIAACLSAGILYESRLHRNCVFDGRNADGVPRSACYRGTHDDFKHDAAGSDKRFNFCLPAAAPDCPRLAVAEGPIDALSVATLVKRNSGDWRDSSYLSLGGTAPRAMLQYLHDHTKITQISLCLDNDEAGITGAGRLERAVQEDRELSARVNLIYRNPPPREGGKDYNEYLCAVIRSEREVTRQRKEASR